MTYDALKAVSSNVRVYGGAVSPRGSDRAGGSRPTHSPTAFIRDLGLAYRASGRQRPVMDAFVIHPYGDNSSQPPTFAHPQNTTITVADYGKLVALLGEAFDGTAQRGSDLPIVYGEYGVESQIPESKAGLYTGTEPATTRPVPEETQASYYQQALGLAFCQPTVEAMLIFLSRDERARPTWQSGVYYVDGTAKSSLARVTDALDRSTGGSVARCAGMRLSVQPTFLRFSGRSAARQGTFTARLRCSLDCTYRVRVENVATGGTKLSRRGRAAVGELVEIDLGTRRLARGTYRFTLRLQHPVNPAAPTLRQGPPFRLPSAFVRRSVPVLAAPDAHDGERARREHEDECERVAALRQAVAERHPDRDDREPDRRVEDPPAPVRPGLDVPAALAPDEEEKERDGEEEGDPEDAADGREHGLERQRDDDDRDQRHDSEAPRERRDAIPESSHEPVVNARTASAPARRVVPANQRSRFGPSAGA